MTTIARPLIGKSGWRPCIHCGTVCEYGTHCKCGQAPHTMPSSQARQEAADRIIGGVGSGLSEGTRAITDEAITQAVDTFIRIAQRQAAPA